MNRQQQIDAFLLAAHRLAVERLRENPSRLQDVAKQLSRWRTINGPTRADGYRDEWASLIDQGIDALEQRVCAEDDRATALRNVSPMSVLITQAERGELLRQARAAQ